jgi:serine/threonine-protein kinase
MRYLTGSSLADRLGHGPLPLPEVARIVERIAEALDYAHNRGVVHRDLKPGNILFDERGKAYLSDFGIAKLADATMKLTGTGIIGTPAYMSPEQARANTELDRRSDVYSLGVMVFELLTGEMPFKARDAVGLLLAHVNEPVPDIRKTRPDLPRESDALIKRAMAKKPEDRYPTTGELANDLSKIATKPSKGRAPVPPSPFGRGVGGEGGMAAAAAKPKTPPPPPPATLKPSQDAATRPEGDSRPTGVIVEPVERPSGSQRPRRPAMWWLLPAALIAVLCLVATIGGAFALPALLAPRTPAAGAHTATAAVAATSVPATRAPTKTTAPPTATLTLTPSLTPAPTLGIGSTQVSEKDGMVMVYAPEGEFLMGSADSDTDAGSGEKPQHTVYLDAFWIDKTEVTNAMYALCVDTGACSPPGSNASYSRLSYYGNSEFDTYPVINVDWNDAKAYCEWAGRRLPSEAEWEKAARGTDGRKYPWGDGAPDATLLNYSGNIGDTTEVGSYPDGASPYGALDMAGNVWEWVNDWYDENYYRNTPSENPSGPDSGTYRVVRGGSWYFSGYNVRPADRNNRGEPTGTSGDIGFRCSLSP